MFKEILKKAVAGTPGATGAIFVDWEGEAVDYFFLGKDDEIKLVGAHHGILMNLLSDAAKNTAQGRVLGMIYTAEDAKVVVQPVKDGYLLVMLLAVQANAGIALRAARRTAGILKEEV